MPLVDALPTDQRVIDLMNAQQRELRRIYQDTDERTEPFDPAILSGDGCVLLAFEENGALLSCGAIKRLNETEAEVKRMFTVPDARGRGLAKQLLGLLIQHGQAAGYQRLVLETGDLQPEAIALYEKTGFTRIENFGYYVGIENSLCYELLLTTVSTR